MLAITCNFHLLWVAVASHKFKWVNSRFCWNKGLQVQSRVIFTMLLCCWSTVCSFGSTWKQHWVNVLCLLSCLSIDILSKQDTLTQCCIDVGPLSMTMVQHQSSLVSYPIFLVLIFPWHVCLFTGGALLHTHSSTCSWIPETKRWVAVTISVCIFHCMLCLCCALLFSCGIFWVTVHLCWEITYVLAQ